MGKLILSIIFLTTAGILSFFWTKPLYNEVKDLEGKKVSLETVIANAKEIQKKRDDVLQVYNSISQENLNKLDKIIPFSPQPVEFIIELQNIIKESGMSLNSIDASSKKDSESQNETDSQQKVYKNVDFLVKVSGPYNSLSSLLSNLEKSLRLVNISSIEFSSSEVDFYEFSVSGVSYWKE